MIGSRPGVRAAIACAACAVVGGTARAGGLDLDAIGARAIGRAGVSVTSEDGGPALVVNPAGMVRRGGLRAQIAIAVHDDDQSFTPAPGASDVTVRDRGGPTLAPLLAVQGTLGPFVVGLAYLETADVTHALPTPELGQPADDVARLFPHRYGGTALAYQVQTLAIGAAMRVGGSLGVGLSFTASRVELSEARHLWAGFAGRDPLGTPSRDVALALSGEDGVVPGLAAGVLLAPASVPLEIALAASWTMDAELEGPAALTATDSDGVPATDAAGARAALRLSAPLVARAGVRYLGERVVVEAAAELAVATGEQPRWAIRDAWVIDSSGAEAEVASLPSLAARRDRAVVRASADLELVRGFVWLTGGWAWASPGMAPARSSPVLADLGGHTLAIGAEAVYGGTAISIGYARTLGRAVTVDDSAIRMENPFDAGTAVAGNGVFDAGHDAFGVSLELAWE